MTTELSPIIKEALILLGKIKYLKEYDSGSRHRLGEFDRKYIKEIEPELLKLKESKDAVAIEILELFREHVAEKERKISGEYDFFEAIERKNKIR